MTSVEFSQENLEFGTTLLFANLGITSPLPYRKADVFVPISIPVLIPPWFGKEVI